MATTGALNAPPKRTAFGDVSNTARGRVSEPVGKEATLKGRVKPPTATIGTRNTRLEDKENRVVPTDSRLRTTAASKAANHASKQQASLTAPTGASMQAARLAPRGTSLTQPRTGGSLTQPPLRNGPARKTTTVYDDRQGQNPSAARGALPPVDDLAAGEMKPVRSPRQCKSQPLLRNEPQVLPQALGKFSAKGDDVIERREIHDNVTEAAYEDAVERLSQVTEDAAPDALGEATEEVHKNLCQVDLEPPLRPSQALESSRLPTAPAEPPVASDGEEYWDDEDEEEQELYDEQGYTTAHSFRSLGEYTTTYPTTLLPPSITADVQRELEMAKAYVLEHQTDEDLEDEAWDVSMVAEYGEEIFEYMRQLEVRAQPHCASLLLCSATCADSLMQIKMLPNPHYMEIQPEIQWSMRSVLMDWLVQVHHRFCLLPETLFLTVNCIDRFLSIKVISLGKLQLVGATALFIAAKYEEINCPSVQEIVYMVDSGYTVDEIVKAERYMLSMLQFELGWPGPMSFLRRISKADDYELDTRTLAKYFLEITIMDERFVSSPPSFLAAGAHCISRMFLDKGEWVSRPFLKTWHRANRLQTPAHVYYSGYTFSQLKPLIRMLFECCQDPRKHHGAVFDKYTSPKYKRASTLVEAKIASGITLSQLYAVASRSGGSSLLDDNIGGPYTASRNLVSVTG